MSVRDATSIEARRQAIQQRLDAARPGPDRNRRGQYATPPGLAADIVREVQAFLAEGADPVRLADPACGTGAFLSAALRVLGRERIAGAIGVEVDPEVCRAARDLWGPVGFHIVGADFTRFLATPATTPAPDLILANPPYVRHHHIERADKQRLAGAVRQTLGIEVGGLAGLHVHFLLLATHWLAEGGLAAWLVPSEFMDVGYGAVLRRFLAERVTLLRLHRFDAADVQFADALVSSAVLVLRKAPPPPGHAARFSLGGGLASPRVAQDVPQADLAGCRKWTNFPGDPGEDRRGLSGVATPGEPTLADLFRIRRGIATGGNRLFVMPRARALDLGLPLEFLRPLLPPPRLLRGTVVEADDDGWPRLFPQPCLLDCDLPPGEVRRRHPALWRCLHTPEARQVRAGYLCSRRDPWYLQERRTPAPFLCTYMGRGRDGRPPFRFVWNRSDAIATNVYLMLSPRPVLAARLREDPDAGRTVHAFLQGIGAAELRGEGRVYGGGMDKIEPRELGRVAATALADRWPELRATCPTPVRVP